MEDAAIWGHKHTRPIRPVPSAQVSFVSLFVYYVMPRVQKQEEVTAIVLVMIRIQVSAVCECVYVQYFSKTFAQKTRDIYGYVSHQSIQQ